MFFILVVQVLTLSVYLKTTTLEKKLIPSLDFWENWEFFREPVKVIIIVLI